MLAKGNFSTVLRGSKARPVTAAIVVVLLAGCALAASGRSAARPQGGVALKKIKASARSGKPAAKGPSANSGQEIELVGSGFGDPLTVEFFGFAGSAFTVNPTLVTSKRVLVTVPAEAMTGPVRIRESAAGPSEPRQLQVVPVVTTVPPGPTAPGSRILIDGTGFAYDSRIYFPGVSAPVAPTIASPTRLDVVVPAGARTGKLTVATVGGRSKPVKIVVASSKGVSEAPLPKTSKGRARSRK